MLQLVLKGILLNAAVIELESRESVQARQVTGSEREVANGTLQVQSEIIATGSQASQPASSQARKICGWLKARPSFWC